ncbi:glycosyltransferase 87 family protein [Microbacterium excoecariae]|uniref:glycosyltransferase 87 family protein n=1 Tax=Microbacterium excoecariae TaxID=2715210 RepID=UPI00140C50B8
MTHGRRVRLLTCWAAFLAAHALAIAAGWLWPNQPMGDTYLVYEPWSRAALEGAYVPGLTEDWVYPPLALAPMLLAHTLVWFSSYAAAWAALATALDVVAFALLVGRGRSRGRVAAGAFWAAFVLLLGPVGLFRIDAVTVPLAVLAALWLGSRPAVAGALVAAGAWIKVWPAALGLAAVVALRSRGRVALGAVAVSAAVAGVVLLAGGGAHLASFVTTQGERGLQVEAIAATPFALGAGGAVVAYDTEILTYQVYAPGVGAVAAALTPLMAIVVAAIAALGAWRIRAGADARAVLPPLALALVVALIATNKVGSPQFQTWLVAPVVLWILWDRRAARTPAALALAIAGLTQLLYPIAYHLVLGGDSVGLAVLALRNVLVVALGVWAVVRLIRTPAPGVSCSSPSPSPRPEPAAPTPPSTTPSPRP